LPNSLPEKRLSVVPTIVMGALALTELAVARQG
jgi:hypothetical protein